MSVDITEFVEINPTNVDAVFKAANGTDFLMIKQVDDADGDDDDRSKTDGADDDKAAKAEFCGDPTCEVCLDRAQKGRLSTAQRRQIPRSSFAIPEKAPESGSYPINDKAHARNALSRVSQHGTPEEKARVRRAVAAKYPGIGKGKKKSKKAASDSQQTNEAAFRAKGSSPGDKQGQTKGNQRGQALNRDVQSDRPRGKPEIPDVTDITNKPGEGWGDTSPNKTSSAEDTQGKARMADEDARQDASKQATSPTEGAGVDMKGHQLDDEGKGTDSKSDAMGTQDQTAANMRANQPKGSDGADQMALQGAQAQKGFKLKLKKGGKKKRKKNAPLSFSAAMKQSGPDRVLSEALASKEFDDMTGAELAEVIVGVLDARDARKAEERKAKKAEQKKKAKKAERKAAKAKATTPEGEEAALEAAKSISPEMLVEGIGARMEAALKESLAPLFGRVKAIEDQPARSRPALNNLAGGASADRGQGKPNGSSPQDFLKPLDDAFKAAKDPYEKEKLGGELTKARLVIAERIRHQQPVSSNDVNALAAASSGRA